MENNYSHLPLVSLEEQFRDWANLLLHNQTAHIYFLRNTGILHRTYQFRDFFMATYNQTPRLIDMVSDIAAEPQSLDRALKSNLTSPTILLAHKLFSGPDKLLLAQTLQADSLVRKNGLLIIHELAPSEVFSNQSLPSIMHHQIKLFRPISDEKSLTQYIKNVAKDWQITLLDNDTKTFVEYCQNQLWLVNELLRLRLTNPNTPASILLASPSVINKSEIIWESLPTLYKEYYLGLPLTPETTKMVEHEIAQFQLPSHNQTNATPYLDQIIQKNKNSLLQITPTKIRYQSQDITHCFSKAERAVLTLLSEQAAPKSREQIGEIYWPSSGEAYSDWALDQLISRLRKKLSKHELPLSIQTLRGKGYALTH